MNRTPAANARRRLKRGMDGGVSASWHALSLVRRDADRDARVAAAVNELLAADSDATTRAVALGNLLAAYGVGTIVAGPIG